MSDRSWRQRFLDINEATVQIGVYISNISESEFYQDARTFDAVVRNIILIGDAASGIHLKCEVTCQTYLGNASWAYETF